MTDNELFTLIFGILDAGLVARLPDVTIVTQQADQPTQQGTPSGPVVLVFKIGDRRSGYLQESDIWDVPNNKMVHTERQYMETTFQLSVLFPQNPTVLSLTASDLVNTCASILQTSAVRTQLSALGMGMLRITDVRNPYFTDDKDRFEANPSFDFVEL